MRLKFDIKNINGDNESVVIDENKFRFSDATISKYMEEEASWYDYYGMKLVEVERNYQLIECEYETRYNLKFSEYKAAGASDKAAEANSKSDPEISALKKMMIEEKAKVRLLQQHLKAWDKNHENANNRLHMLRKELDKFRVDFKETEVTFQDKLEEIMSENNT